MNLARRRYRADNYLYLLTEGDDAALVDPGDPEAALALALEHGVRPRFILHTHGHADHTGGTAEIVARSGAAVYGSRADAWGYPPDVEVDGRATLALGALRLAVHPAPGHTPGSVVYACAGHLFTGDTLFWAGAGNCKSGDPRLLADTFQGVLSRLDGDLLVQPGHDYAEQNLRFALHLEPGSPAVGSRLESVRATRARGGEPEPSTLAEERRTNPFLRADSLRPALARLGHVAGNAREAFVAMRRVKDGWRE